MCDFKSFPKEIEHSSENKVISIFLKTFAFTFLFQFSLCLDYFFFILTMHILTKKIYFCKFANIIILFQEALQFKEAIIICCNR